MKRQTRIFSSAAFLAVLFAGAMPLSGQYSYYYSSNLSPINAGDWTQNGTGTYGGSSSENSLIATAAVPNGGSGFGASYETLGPTRNGYRMLEKESLDYEVGMSSSAKDRCHWERLRR